MCRGGAARLSTTIVLDRVQVGPGGATVRCLRLWTQGRHKTNGNAGCAVIAGEGWELLNRPVDPPTPHRELCQFTGCFLVSWVSPGVGRDRGRGSVRDDDEPSPGDPLLHITVPLWSEYGRAWVCRRPLTKDSADQPLAGKPISSDLSRPTPPERNSLVSDDTPV